jgi:ribose-phosphate pyrophosphokinase
MLRRTERILENIPVGSLGLISLTGCEELGKKVDDYLVKWRHESGNAFRDDIAFSGYEKDSYLLDARALAQEKQKEFSESPFAEKICILW